MQRTVRDGAAGRARRAAPPPAGPGRRRRRCPTHPARTLVPLPRGG